MSRASTTIIVLSAVLAVSPGCSGDSPTGFTDLGIAPVANADAGSSYSNSSADIRLQYASLPQPLGTGDLRDAVAYLDADGDGDTDVFVATGQYLLDGEVSSVLALNDGSNNFTSSTAPFGGDMPPATHARKAIVSDFNSDGLQDVFVFDHGFDANPFPGSQPKLILQDAAGNFSWRKLADQTGFHHGGSAADIDNDGDVDIFVGGFQPFFFVNDGNASFTMVEDRFDRSINKVFSAELIDIDRDGFVDLLAGAHERDGDRTAVYWGNSSGRYTQSLRTVLPTVTSFGAILDFDAEDVDGDGDRDLIVNRTRDGDDGSGLGFYVGRTVQLLHNDGGRGFTDVTSTRIDNPGGDTDNWHPWVTVRDLDGDGHKDFGPDDIGRGFFYRNNGSGAFTLSQLNP